MSFSRKDMKKLKIETGSGHYLIDSPDDVFSFMVWVPKEREDEIYLTLNFKCNDLRERGKLSDLTWIDDTKIEIEDSIAIVRRWARIDSTVFIPNSSKENSTNDLVWTLN